MSGEEAAQLRHQQLVQQRTQIVNELKALAHPKRRPCRFEKKTLSAQPEFTVQPPPPVQEASSQQARNRKLVGSILGYLKKADAELKQAEVRLKKQQEAADKACGAEQRQLDELMQQHMARVHVRSTQARRSECLQLKHEVDLQLAEAEAELKVRPTAERTVPQPPAPRLPVYSDRVKPS